MKNILLVLLTLYATYASAQYRGQTEAYRDSANTFSQQNKFTLPVLIPLVPTTAFNATSKSYVDQEIFNASAAEVTFWSTAPTPITLFVSKYYIDTLGTIDKVYIWNGASTASGKYDLYKTSSNVNAIAVQPLIAAATTYQLPFTQGVNYHDRITTLGDVTLDATLSNMNIGDISSITITPNLQTNLTTINFSLGKFTIGSTTAISITTYKPIVLTFRKISNTGSGIEITDIQRNIANNQDILPYGSLIVTTAGTTQIITTTAGTTIDVTSAPSRFKVLVATAASPNNNIPLRYGATGTGQYTVVVNANTITVTAASGTFAVGDILSFYFN